MAVAQSEIEVLLKMRTEGQKALDLFSGELDHLGSAGTKAGHGLDQVDKGARGAGAASTAAGVAVGLLADRVGRSLVGAFKTSLAAADKLDAAMIGLGATAKAFSVDAGEAQQAAQKLASDGLMSVGDAAAGLKNLLAAGFGLDQATVLMERFKDSAAFGRQGALDFGEAIVGATEGIKNGNSALVDNAGVTKNLSNILVEAGFSAQDLSKAQSDVNVRQAIFGGILKETNPQLGQTQLYLKTAAGAQAQFNTEITKAQQAIGKELQPVLREFLAALTPIVRGVTAWSGVLVPLGLAVGAIVGPLVAARLAAAAGIPTFASLGSSVMGGLTAFQKAYTGAGTLRGGLAALSSQSGFTVKDLGLLKTFGLAAAAAFVGWQIGTVINQLFGLDEIIARLLTHQDALDQMRHQNSAQVAASLAQKEAELSDAVRDGNKALVGRLQGEIQAIKTNETWKAQQDTINKAIAAGAIGLDQITDHTAQYTAAIQYNNAIRTMQIAGVDASTIAQRRALDVQVTLGQITQQEYQRRVLALDALEKSNLAIAAHTSLTNALAGASAKVRDEIGKTHLSVKELTGALEKDEDAFKKWAEQHGLSEASVKFLQDAIDKRKDAQKKAREEDEKATKVIEQQRAALDGLGIVTLPEVQTQLADLATLQARATKEGVSGDTVLRMLAKSYRELYEKAMQSGVGVDQARAAWLRAKDAADKLEHAMAAIDWSGQLHALDLAIGKKREYLPLIDTEETRTERLAGAYKFFGIESQKALDAAATAAIYDFNLIKESGTATPKQIETAHKKMVEAIKAQSGELPGAWEKVIVPGVKRQLGLLNDAVGGSLAQMLLGAKGFADGWTDIWKSIKAAAINVFNEIANAFIGSMLKRMLGALAGSNFGGGILGVLGKGATGAAGAAVLPGTLFAAPSAAAMTVGGTAAATGGTAAAAGGAGAAATTGGFLASGLGTALGGVGIGAAGFGLGDFLSTKFGRTAGVLGGIGGGAATGALIGTAVFPGIGTGVGALIGGISGLIGGLFGKGEGAKVNDTRDQFLGKFGGAGTGQGSGFANLASQLREIGPEGDALFARVLNSKKAKDFEAAVRDVAAALDKQKQKTQELAKATESSSAAQMHAIEQVQGLLDPAEAAALAKGYAQAQADGFKGSQEEFLRDQLDLYGKVQEGDARLKTWFSATTIAAFNAIKAGHADLAASVVADMKSIDAQMQTLQQSIANEAPEQEMGEVERQARQQIDDLARRREALLRELEAAGVAAADTVATNAEESGNAIRDHINGGLGEIRNMLDENADKWDQWAQRVQGAIGRAQVPGLEAPEPPGVGGAASGIFANRPTLAIFGEGGEPELGGPVSFMSKALAGAIQQINLPAPSASSNGGGGDVASALEKIAASLALVAQMTAAAPTLSLDGNALYRAFTDALRNGAPIVVQAIDDNVGGAKTKLQRSIER